MPAIDHAALLVLADRLQAHGDARGELLALELEAATAESASESRRLSARAQAVRARVPDLAWPPALWTWRGLIRAGMLVCGAWSPRRVPELPAVIDHGCRDLAVPIDAGGLGLAALAEAAVRRDVRLDGVWEQRLDAPPDLLHRAHEPHDADVPLRALGLRRPLTTAAQLLRLRGLQQLDLGVRRPPLDMLDTLPELELRTLGLHVDATQELDAVLAACPGLEQLRLHRHVPALQRANGLERLRRLALFDTGAASSGPERLSDDLPLTGLDALTLHAPTLADLERVAAYGLRELCVLEPLGDADAIIARLAALDSLEQLTIRWQHNRSVVPKALSRMPRLRSLELAGRFHGDIEAPPLLERLVFGSGVTHLRVRGQLAELHSETGTIFNVLHTVSLAGVRTLGLSATWGRPAELDGIAAKLLSVETLVIGGGQVQPTMLDWMSRLPRLRTVVWPVLSIRQQRAASERLPNVQIMGADIEQLRQDWPPPSRCERLAEHVWPRP